MRHTILTTSLLALLAAPAFADTFTGDAKVEAVTISQGGLATVLREVTLTLPAGQHEIIVPDLPANLPPQGLRVTAPEGVRIGGINLANDRLPVTPDQTRPDIQAAKDRVEELTEALRAKRADIAEIRLRVSAAEAQIAFLQNLATRAAADSLSETGIPNLRALAQMVGEDTLTLRADAHAAEQDAQAAERALKDDEEALEDAQQDLAALQAPQEGTSVLTFSLVADTDTTATFAITSREGGAEWQPVYDLRLTTGDTPRLVIERAVVITQRTGEDWTDVALTLSTARVGGQSAPGTLRPKKREIISEEDLESERILAQNELRSAIDSLVMEAPVIAVDSPAMISRQGANVSYAYPARVTIRDGVDDLRLPLDTVETTPDVWAAAVPSRDDVAYLVAEFTNVTDELLLPGEATLYADGALIGFDNLPLMPAGAAAAGGFGPIDGLQLSRQVPDRSQGETGVFISANAQRERIILGVENLTDESWPIRLHDQVPFSEQDDLVVSYEASPTPSVTDREGARGLLEWHFDLAPGATQSVTLDVTLDWPDGYVLR